MADTIDAVDPDPPPPPPPQTEVAVDPPPAIPVVEEPPPKEGCFAKRSGLEKCLLILVIIIVIVSVALVIAFLIYYFFSRPPEGTCLTDGCVKSASRLKNRMDEDLDPCNRFYEYACQGWLDKKVLDPGENKIDVESQLSHEHMLKLKSLLEDTRGLNSGDEDEDGASEFSKKPRLFYRSCLDVDKLDERKTVPFMEVVNIVGKFPTIDSSWNETDFNLQDMLRNLARMSVMPLFDMSVDQEVDVSDNRLILSDAKLGLHNREYYIGERDSKMLSDYQQWMVNTLVLLGADVNVAEEDVEKVVDLEISLAKLMRDDNEKSSFKSSYKLMDADSLQNKYPWLNWLEFFKDIDVYISKDDAIILNKEQNYFDKLESVVDATSKRVLANYLMSHLLPLTGHLGTTFVAEMDKYSKNVHGKEILPRWEHCANMATEKFAEAVSRMYIDSYFKPESREDVKVIVDDVTNAFKDYFNGITWMMDETRGKAFKKLKSMEVKIGYPDYLLNDDKLNQLYKDVSANEAQYMENMVSLLYFKASQDMKRLTKPLDKEEWVIQPSSVEGLYDRKTNKIVLPAAFLQPPIYSTEFSSAMNYAGVASIVGREMIHGFDRQGRKYDDTGKKKKWWQRKDEQKYESRRACFLNQWECLKWDNEPMKSERVIDENIAYVGGLKQSYKAYRNMITRKGSEDQRLPGLGMDNDQVFFLSYAQIWCAKYSQEAKKEFVSTSTHPPFPYRVSGTLQNFEAFSQAFKCDVGTRMNPRDKCYLW